MEIKQNLKGHVFINGYGVVKFRATQVIGENENLQYKGEVRLPKEVRTTEGKKWVDHHYFYTPEQIYSSKKKAMQTIK